MSKIEEVLTHEEIAHYAELDTVIGRMCDGYNRADTHYTNPVEFVNQIGFKNFVEIRSDYTTAHFSASMTITRHQKNGRICGLVTGENSDGSLRISLLGNSEFNTGGTQGLLAMYNNRARGRSERFQGMEEDRVYVTMLNGVMTPTYDPDPSDPADIFQQKYTVYANQGEFYRAVPLETILSGHYQPEWGIFSGHNIYNASFMRYNNEFLDVHNKWICDLTTNPNTTLKLNVPIENVSFLSVADTATYSFGFNNIGGDFYTICYGNLNSMCGMLGGDQPTLWGISDQLFDPDRVIHGTYSAFAKVFNTVLTRNEAEAIEYVNTGVLPSDAFLFPYDVDNIPTNDTGLDPSQDDPTPIPENPNEQGGDPDDDITPTPLVTPTSTPQSLTNNNLYWLLSTQLATFIDWFWTDATDIASVGDLWDKIKGLYDNLSEAVLSIRYMPVNSLWFGGTSVVNSIIVGMIEKQEQVLAINKSVSPIRDIGEIDIKEFYNAFTDYSPYTDIMLYLPYHGFLDLDTNILMGHKLKISVAYDITSGTMQYFIFRDSVLINTCVVKMAVDIPISLQTKSERDSTIFNNVMNATSSLIGASASVATGNPIGLVMSMGGMFGSQTHGAPMSLKGTVGECGAFYAPNRCAIYVKSPKYNKPKKGSYSYASQVGYPTNDIKLLSVGMGYAEIYNPRITFSKVPLEEEIQEIYSYLEKGVIL